MIRRVASLGQCLAKRRRPRFGSLPPGGGLQFRQPLRDQPRPLREMIPGKHNVVQAHGQRRLAELVEPRPRQPLQAAVQIVAEHARGPALKRRQIGDGLGRQPGQSLGQRGQGVILTSRDFEPVERVRRQEREPAQSRRPQGAVQKQTVRQPAERRQRGFRVRRRVQFLDNRAEGGQRRGSSIRCGLGRRRDVRQGQLVPWR